MQRKLRAKTGKVGILINLNKIDDVKHFIQTDELNTFLKTAADNIGWIDEFKKDPSLKLSFNYRMYFVCLMIIALNTLGLVYHAIKYIFIDEGELEKSNSTTLLLYFF